jgi:hypothetical protein
MEVRIVMNWKKLTRSVFTMFAFLLTTGFLLNPSYTVAGGDDKEKQHYPHSNNQTLPVSIENNGTQQVKIITITLDSRRRGRLGTQEIRNLTPKSTKCVKFKLPQGTSLGDLKLTIYMQDPPTIGGYESTHSVSRDNHYDVTQLKEMSFSLETPDSF